MIMLRSLLRVNGVRNFTTTVSRPALTPFRMPAMSPTMTEGGVSEWKVAEGASFSEGDVLLVVETDKAAIDVEAQEDGILAKIVIPNGASEIKVGDLIGVLAEEGDDISNIDIAALSAGGDSPAPTPAKSEAPSSSPTPAPAADAPPAHIGHPHSTTPLLPSVERELALAGIDDPSKIKPTGYKNTLTKGDVLAYLGKISSPYGTLPPPKPHSNKHPYAPDDAAPAPAEKKVAPPKPLTGPETRRLIASALKPKHAAAPQATPTFDSILEDY